MSAGQSALTRPSAQSGDLYGGIELSDEGVKAIALQVSQGDDEPSLKTVYSEIIRLSLGRTSGGEFPPQASADSAKAVLKVLKRLREQYGVKLDHIYFIGASGLKDDHPKDLESVISNTTGLKLNYLSPVEEVQLSIAGTIQRTTKVGTALIDNRNTSALIHIGVASTLGGYEMLKYAPSESDLPAFDFIAMSVPQGVVSYANEISRTVGPGANLGAFIREVKDTSAMNFRQALRRELETKPGLMHRKRVFLTGNLAWAMATMIYPDDRSPFVNITFNAVAQFADRIARSPKELAFQDLSFIRDRKVRQDVEQEIEAIKATFTPQQLIAGAAMLKATAEELQWKDKKIMFARNGHLGCILSYTRLQIGK
jgi:hypothetical protein